MARQQQLRTLTLTFGYLTRGDTMALSLGNNPYIKIDSQGRSIQSSSEDMTFRGDYGAGTTLIYRGFARPGSLTSAAVWQIAKMTYDGNSNILTIQWAQDSFGHASSEYIFIWDNRASLTYS